MPQDVEAGTSNNCVLYWLSTRLDIQTVNLATASLPTHACFTVLLLFDCKISSAIIGVSVQVCCTASPHTFRTALLYGHRTNAHVTGSQQCHYQKLPLLIVPLLSGCPIIGLRKCPCNAILPAHPYCFYLSSYVFLFHLCYLWQRFCILRHIQWGRDV